MSWELVVAAGDSSVGFVSLSRAARRKTHPLPSSSPPRREAMEVMVLMKGMAVMLCLLKYVFQGG